MSAEAPTTGRCSACEDRIGGARPVNAPSAPLRSATAVWTWRSAGLPPAARPRRLTTPGPATFLLRHGGAADRDGHLPVHRYRGLDPAAPGAGGALPGDP